MQEKLVAIDGNSLMHRAFYALPPMNNQEGTPTNAVYGFTNMLMKILKEQQPQYVAVAFDMHGPTFRHELFAEYKAGRKKTPEELIVQFDLIKEVLTAMGIAILENQGYEADDILGNLSKRCEEADRLCVIITGDRDALQLVGDRTTVLLTKRGITDIEKMDAQGVVEKMGVTPDHVTDLKGLMGDSSDNIPGVPGIGPKTAATLLEKFTTLEGVLENADHAGSKKVNQLLQEYQEQARLSKELATIDRDIPEFYTFEDLCFTMPSRKMVQPVFTKLGFLSLLNRFEDQQGDPDSEQPSPKQALERAEIADLQTLKDTVLLLMGKPRVAILLGQDFILCDGEREYQIHLNTTLLSEGIGFYEAAECMLPLLREEKVQKIFYDAKGYCHQTHTSQQDISAHTDDVMLLAYVKNASDGQLSIQNLAERHGVGYRAESAEVLLCLYDALMAEQTEDIDAIYRAIELPLWRVLYDMEVQGFKVDIPTLRQMGQEYAQKIQEMERSIHALAGGAFNINSPKQLGEVLFERLGLPVIKKTKTGYSTDISVLEELEGKHPIVEQVMEYRKATKLKSTYLDGLLQVADPKSGKIHTRFNQNVTATGRISSAEPNLQNIPVRTEQGREIRRAFVAEREDRLLVVADYSQIELRILAHMSGDPAMIQIFRSGGDIHRKTASEVFHVPPEAVDGTMRSAAKAVNFGIVYGISDFGLSRNLRIPRKKAAEYIEAYLEKFSGVKRFMDQCVENAKEYGYVHTMMGRRRYVPEIRSRNYNTRMFGERIAMNAPIQGTAADLIKCAMVQVPQILEERKLDAKLILQVHDELIIDCQEKAAHEVMQIVKEEMEQVIQLDVPLIAEVGCGKTWLDAK